jgi:hypothetical protein
MQRLGQGGGWTAELRESNRMHTSGQKQRKAALVLAETRTTYLSKVNSSKGLLRLVTDKTQTPRKPLTHPESVSRRPAVAAVQ